MSNGSLERAILETLAYSDIFEYPLRLDELHRYLPTLADVDELPIALRALNGQVQKDHDLYFLAGRAEIVQTRSQRAARSNKLMPTALRYGRVLGNLPFIRMAALTGSLAVLNISKNADFDYMLVTQPGRVWTARAFAVLFNRIVRRFGHTICPNLIVSENALEWPLHDLYSARELCQMVPITGMETYYRLLKANEWAKDLLPNAFQDYNSARSKKEQRQVPALQSLLEFPFRGRFGNRFEQWEMNRKIARFSKQAGFGEETVFNAEVCQGNFHHHRKWTRELFEENLNRIVSRIEQHEVIPDQKWRLLRRTTSSPQ